MAGSASGGGGGGGGGFFASAMEHKLKPIRATIVKAISFLLIICLPLFFTRSRELPKKRSDIIRVIPMLLIVSIPSFEVS